MQKLSIFLFFLFFDLTTYAQNSITGVVTDAESGETLPEVNVHIKGTTAYIHNLTSTLVYSNPLTSSVINISFLPAEVYLISLFTEKGVQLGSEKIIKGIM